MKNPLKSDEIFAVKIIDEEIKQMGFEEEILFIKDLKDLLFWHRHGYYKHEEITKLEEDYNDIFLPKGGIFLKADQKITLLF